jgi:hypothetical protein
VIFFFRIEQILVAANTSVAPPERPAHSRVASVLPPPPTVSSSRIRMDREPQTTSVGVSPIHDEDSSSSDESSDHGVDHRRQNESGSEHNTISDCDIGDTGSHHVGPPKSKMQQHGEIITGTTVDVSEEVAVPVGDVSMHRPPHVPQFQRGRARNVKAIGSFHSQPTNLKSGLSSGASRTYGGVIGGKALGNVPNIGDFNSTDVNSQFVDVEGTVNLFPSNTRPTTLDVDETAIIAVTIPFEKALSPLLQQVAKYYSPLSDNNERVYILDPNKHKWIVKGRFRDAVEFEDSVLHFWDQTKFGPILTIFLENDPEIVASAIPPSFHTHRSSSLLKSGSTSRSTSAPNRHSGSPGPTPFRGPSVLTDLHKEALLIFLGISLELPSLTDSLRNT